MLHRLAKELGLPKLNFQVIRRTIATLGKNKGHPKDIQGMMRHTRLATTMEVYMQSLEPELRKAINSIHDELMATGTERLIAKKPSASRRSRQREAEVASSNANANNSEGARERSERGDGKGRKSAARQAFAICGQNAGKRFGRDELNH